VLAAQFTEGGYMFLDSRLFEPEAIDAETAKLNARIEKEMDGYPPIYTLEPRLIRAARESGQSIWGPVKRLPEAEDRCIPGPGGQLRLRIFVPKNPQGVYLHFHGGGFMLGSADQFDELIVGTGRACKVVVVSVDYRLAPENPHPAAVDDGEAAALWLVQNCISEFGSDRLIIGGESAGANLAVVCLLRMRDRHDFRGFQGAVLTYGAFDLSLTPSARNWGERNLVLTTRLIKWFHDNYAPTDKLTDPEVSPLHADLSYLPTALFTVGTLDPLLDDSLFMYARWVSAGNPAELKVYPGGVHAFNAFPCGLANQANRRIVNFLTKSVAY
jgi:acetyl esterase/lipase